MRKTTRKPRASVPPPPAAATPPPSGGPKPKPPIPTFDQTEVYKKEVLPALNALHELCRKHGLPSVCSVCYQANDESGLFHFSQTARDHWMPESQTTAARLLDKDESARVKVFSGTMPAGMGLGLVAMLSALLSKDDDPKPPAKAARGK